MKKKPNLIIIHLIIAFLMSFSALYLSIQNFYLKRENNTLKRIIS